MNEELSGNEFLLFLVSAFVAIAGAATWHVPVTNVARLGRPRKNRLLLFLFPLACLGLIWVVLEPPTPVVVERPSRFGWLWHRFWTLLGLTRNELGSFGGLIAEPGGGHETKSKSGS